MFDMFEKWDGTPRQEPSSTTSSTSSTTSDPYASASYTASPYDAPQKKKIFVLSVGGSVFFGDKIDVARVAKFCETLNELMHEGSTFAIVVGGGRIARVYQAGAKALGANNFEQDEIAINVTKTNAMLFTYQLNNAWKEILADPREAERILSLGKVPVFAGSIPGQTTDSVAALLSESLEGEFINISNVDGIYSDDPAKVERAKMYTELTHATMNSLVKAAASKPGAHTFIDPHAGQILQRSKIKSYFVNGNDLENFKALVRGQPFKGTTVQTSSAADMP